MRSLFVLSSVAAVVACLAGSTAFAQDSGSLAKPTDAALIARAKAEGAVTLYGSSSVAAMESDVKGFQAAYGIPATYLQLTSGPLTARVDQEMKAGQVIPDVILTADVAALNRWTEAGQLAKLPSFDHPGRTDYTGIVQVVYQGFLYNT